MAKGGSGKVISMAEKMYIKQLYEDGVSKSEIQRRTKVNYRTVCKYADMEDWNDDKLPNMEPDNYPVLGEYIPLINEWLEGDATAPRKQRHTAKRIYGSRLHGRIQQRETIRTQKAFRIAPGTRRLLAACTPHGSCSG